MKCAAFLIAAALYWLDTFHVDGLRIDGVDALLADTTNAAFFAELTRVVAERQPGALVIADTDGEATARLGFSFGWSAEPTRSLLSYMSRDPVHRRFHHDEARLGVGAAAGPCPILPLSHEEVSAGRGSILSRMPGDAWRRFANLRALHAMVWARPGKKLLFMGAELAQERAWSHTGETPWGEIQDPARLGAIALVGDLNRLYRAEAALHVNDCGADGFAWVVADDRDNSVFAWLRIGGQSDPPILAVANLTPVPRFGYRVGAPLGGSWREILNTDASAYGGSGLGNFGAVEARYEPSHGQPCSLTLTLPPLAVLLLKAPGA